MDVKMERLDENKVQLEIQVEPQQVEKAMDGAYRKLAQAVRIPGFRQGKVPRNVLQMRLGEEALREEALEILLPDAYSRAVKETRIEPVSHPEVSDVQFGEDSSVSFSAQVEVKPEVTLGRYRGLEVAREEAEISEEMVEERLRYLQEQVASWSSEENDAAREGDLVLVDLVVELEGEQRPEWQAEGQAVVLGSGRHLPELEQGLQGAWLGEEKRIDVVWPEEGQPEELAGREAVLLATVQEIKRQHLPPLDDEFAKDISDYSTLEEVRQDIRNRLEQAEERRLTERRRKQATEQAAAEAEVAVPPSMLERRMENMRGQLEDRMERSGIDMEGFLEETGKNREEMEIELEESARESLKQELVLEAVARAEELEVSDEEIAEELASAARAMAVQERKSQEDMEEELKQQGYEDALRDSIMRRKAVDLLLQEARDVEPPQAETGGGEQGEEESIPSQENQDEETEEE